MPQQIPNMNTRVYTNIFLLVYALVHFLVMKFVLHFGYALSAFDSGITALTILLMIYLIDYIKAKEIEGISKTIFLIFQSLLLTGIWVYLLGWTIEGLFPRNILYIQFYEDSRFARGIIAWVILTNFSVLHYFSVSADREKEEKERTIYNEQLKKDAELYKLRQQINPHFLFNTLNSINALISIDAARARDMIQQMSQYFRNSINKEDHQWVSMEEELNDIKIYFEIEKVRFGHRLSFTEDIDASCLPCQVPPFLIQPLVENAIKYGLYGTTGSIHIRLTAGWLGNRDSKMLRVSIVNPFDSSTKQISGTGFGLNAIRRRLYLLFGRNDLLQTFIESYGQDTDLKLFKASIDIPAAHNT